MTRSWNWIGLVVPGALAVAVVAAAPTGRGLSTPREDEAALARRLRALDQALLVAIDVKDREPWRRVMAPGFVYVAEDGRAIDGPTLLAALEPSGTDLDAVPPFRIRDYQLHLEGDVATVLHHDEETGSYLGSPLRGVDVTTEVWQRRGAEWRLRLVHTTPVPTTPPPVALPDRELDALAGDYAAGGRRFSLRREGGGVVWVRPDGPPVPLSAEARDVLFEPSNARVRYVFHRDAGGAVSEMLRRNENRAVRFERLR